MAVLGEYYAALGDLIHRFEGTLEQFAGDGLMVFFNDPLPCDDAAAAGRPDGGRDAQPGPGPRRRRGPRRGHDLGFSVGIAQGYATLGRIGFEGRYDYAAIGSVTNLASHGCAPRPTQDQILITQRVHSGAAGPRRQRPGRRARRCAASPARSRATTCKGLDAARVTS